MTASLMEVAKTTVRENRLVRVPGALGPGNGDGGCSDVPSSSYFCV